MSVRILSGGAVVGMALLLLAAPIRAEVYCDGGTGCLVLEETRTGHRVAVRNLTPAPRVFTVYFTRFEDLSSNVELDRFMDHPSVSVTAPPHGEVTACLLRRAGRRPFFYAMFHHAPGALNARHAETVVYELPFNPGAGFEVGQAEDGPTHQGEHFHAVDWLMPNGTRLRAARGGVVVAVAVADTGHSFTDESYKMRTNHIRIAHDDGTVASYEHIRQFGAAVTIGQRVRAGDFIGWSGDVGFSSTPHLHFVVHSPINGRDRVSHPLRFRTADGIVAPEVGAIHGAP